MTARQKEAAAQRLLLLLLQQFLCQLHVAVLNGTQAADGSHILHLNKVRCAARSAELAAVAALGDRADILRAMNRMSSMLYILMIREKANLGKR